MSGGPRPGRDLDPRQRALAGRMGVAHPGFLHKVVHWFGWRARIRQPRVLARVERQVPLARLPRVRPAVASAPPSVVPRIVHQTWLDDRFGRSHVAALTAFRDLNPEYEFRLHVDADLDAFMREHWGSHPIFDVYSRARYGPMKTDIWRYCVLFTEGGVYCDINKGLVSPLARLIGSDAGGMVSYEGRARVAPPTDPAAARRMAMPDGVVGNWLMAFRPQHPVLGRLIEAIVRDAPRFEGRTAATPKDDILRLTGPLQLTAAFAAALAAGEADDVTQVGEEFDGDALWELRGSWVRFATRPPYALEKDAAILS